MTTAAAAADRVRGGDERSVRLVEEALSGIDAWNPRLRAFLTVCREEALAGAEAVDTRVAAGEDPGPLAGLPVAIKDNLCTQGIPTTCGSRILEGFRPHYNATAVRKLTDAGAVVIGKTNLDEFAMGSSNENSAYGAVANPWDLSRVPGGSSGGSAAAVASGCVSLALGSDTGGSIRQPAAFCGVLGWKPTYGRVSRFGLVAFASSLDQVGGFAQDVDSLERLAEVISGPDDRDSTSGYEAPAAETGPLRVGVARSLIAGPGVADSIRDACGWAETTLADEGWPVEEVGLPDSEASIAAYYLLATAEASSNLARYDGVRYGLRVPGADLGDMYRQTRHEGFGPEVKRRILLGTFALSAGYVDAYYRKALAARRRLRAELDRIFAKVDVILLPTTPTPAFRLGEKTDDPVSMYLSDVFTVLANLSGVPGLSVPAGLDPDGLPVGVQFLAPAWRDQRLFAAARALETSRRWTPPPETES